MIALDSEIRQFDLIGIGVGPANLSLASLLARVPDLDALFLEARSSFSWHPGLLFAHSTLQSPFLKDLVTLADPTNPYSFINYLYNEHRLYQFIVADYRNVTRKEFDLYLKWVCQRLNNLRFSSAATSVSIQENGKSACFRVESASGRYASKAIALGVGREQNIPKEAERHLCERFFHANEYLHRAPQIAGKHITVVGGGQTGAEVFFEIITRESALPHSVTWINRRHNFIPFDESPFANELYVPGYSNHFFGQSAEERTRLLDAQKYSSDGVLPSLLEAIYRRLYELRLDQGGRYGKYRLLPGRKVESIEKQGAGWLITTAGSSSFENTYTDLVILATGLTSSFPTLLNPLKSRISLGADNSLELNEDFSLRWEAPPGLRIFAHNAGLQSHGWIDANLAGIAWRSATIVNSLVGSTVYDIGDTETIVDWSGKASPGAAPAICEGVKDVLL